MWREPPRERMRHGNNGRRFSGMYLQEKPTMIQISPSILSADFTNLGDAVSQAERAGADRLHIDVMDGRFVPNISMGPVVVEALRPVTDLPLEVHLMIDSPDRYLSDFLTAGADIIIVHQENVPHVHRVVQKVQETKKKIGVALNPGTPAHTLDAVIEELDLVLAMTVNPGFSGQIFIPGVLPKVREIRQRIAAMGTTCDLEVDGGITETTGPLAAEAGANVLVAATAIFKHRDGIAAGIKALRDSSDQPGSLV